MIDFPSFEWDEDAGRWTFVHHPFTGVLPEHADLIETDPGAVISQAYDLVWNGWELGSGSIRIHDQEIQKRVFRAIGLEDDDAERKFGFLLEALRMGPPPHGGFAMGIERFAALLAGEPNIRELIAFPKVGERLRPAERGSERDRGGSAARARNQTSTAGLNPLAVRAEE